jgi:tetratricopeptide (TPR) repeat protein
MTGKSPNILFVRGQVLAEMGRKRARDAIRDLDIALTEATGTSEGYALRARAFAYAQLGRWKNADADIERSLTLAPDNAWAYYTLAQMCELRDQRDKALDHYKTALTKENPPLNTPKRDLALQRLKSLA